MNDRFKCRVWDYKRKEMRNVWSITPFGAIVNDVKTNGYKISFKDCCIMQCTGLRDKNGELIFEGDILKTKTGLAKVVYFLAEFVLESIHNTDFSFIDWDTVEQEVIGNIYENPELLEVQNG